jgi:MFS family permease
MSRSRGEAEPVLGLRENRGQFALLVAVVGFVGAMVGIERSVLPLVASTDFGLASAAAATSFIVAFGPSKAFANLFAGRLSERVGRRRVLIAGWLVGLPVPFIVIAAPEWGWIVGANVLLGINQGLCWSMTVNMKADLVGPVRRGLALGLNEAAGYLGVGIAALAAGLVAERYGLRPAPFYLMIAIAAAGTALSVLAVRETAGHVAVERGADPAEPPSLPRAFAAGTWARPDLVAYSQAGLVTNLTDGVAWGIVPLALTAAGASVADVGLVAAIYPITWGLLQAATGAASDRLGRVPLITAGMVVQGIAIGLFALGGSLGLAIAAAVVLGLGTAMTYPTLLAAVGDAVRPGERATAIGVYRFWRDIGTLVGALGAALVADALGFDAAFLVSSLVAVASGIIVWRVVGRQST